MTAQVREHQGGLAELQQGCGPRHPPDPGRRQGPGAGVHGDQEHPVLLRQVSINTLEFVTVYP